MNLNLGIPCLIGYLTCRNMPDAFEFARCQPFHLEFRILPCKTLNKVADALFEPVFN